MSAKRNTVLLTISDPKLMAVLQAILNDHYDLLKASTCQDALRMVHGGKKIEAAVVATEEAGTALLQYFNSLKENPTALILIETKKAETAEEAEKEFGALDRIPKRAIHSRLLKSVEYLIKTQKQLIREQREPERTFDELTGLFLRRRFQIKTAEMLKAHPRTSFVMVHFDIDRFRLFNSYLGERQGDRLIRFESDIVRYIASGYPFSTYCRVGGDQFLLCHAENREQIRKDSALIADMLAKYRSDYFLEPSFGVYQINDRNMPVESMMMRAMLAAKKSKHQYHHYIGYYEAEMDRELSNETFVDNEMQNAMIHEEYQVYFQPKVDPRTGIAEGSEALVRWLHPTRGLIMPGDFIPQFERNGFITQLDWYMWQHVAAYLQAWIRAGYDPRPVSVNISRVSMYNGKLVEQLNAMLKHYQVRRSLFELELTESAFSTNPDMIRARIKQLRDAGYTILMDDFGSSYSSLNSLRNLPVSKLKMDMRFLPQKFNKKEEKAFIIVSSVLDMADRIGLPVIAEGVETKEQKDFLKNTSCELVQGYYYEKPIPLEQYIDKYVRKQGKH